MLEMTAQLQVLIQPKPVVRVMRRRTTPLQTPQRQQRGVDCF